MSIDREPKPGKYTEPGKHAPFRVALSFAAAAGMAGIGAGCAPDGRTVSSETPTPQVVISASQLDLNQPQLVPAVSAAEIPTLTPTPKPTEVVPATFTPKVDNTPTIPPPTETPPPPTVTAKPIGIPEVKLTPTPEQPKLPALMKVYYGIATDQKTRKKKIEILVVKVSSKESLTLTDEALGEFFVFGITSPDSPGGGRGHYIRQIKPRKTKDSITLAPLRTLIYNEKEETIKGLISFDAGDADYELKLVGEGKLTIFSFMNKIIQNQSADQPTTIQKELKIGKINPDLWP